MAMAAMRRQGNYLRVRGEYLEQEFIDAANRELPPRARRIHQLIQQAVSEGGNYLRVRGEYIDLAYERIEFEELPPRARRIPRAGAHARPGCGTTSACAENTRPDTVGVLHEWNYLRVRGEYTPASCHRGYGLELPPRARRILPHHWPAAHWQGTTSACAENTHDGHG